MARRKDYRESKKMGSYDYAKGGVSKTITHDWSEGQEGAMEQADSGSMNYYSRKGKLDREDEKRLKRDMLDQSNSKY
jgi:hypothetical protein